MAGRNAPDSTMRKNSELFSALNLPFGVFSANSGQRRVGVALGDDVLDVAALADDGHLDDLGGVWHQPTLNGFLARGRSAWAQVRSQLSSLVGQRRGEVAFQAYLQPRRGVQMHLPVAVADYVDFYSSEAHATNVGRIFRPDGEPLLPNWKRLPVGYHGRAGTIVVSGTGIRRPAGQRRDPATGEPVFAPSGQLDIETEVGFIVGVPSPLGEPVGVDDFADHAFGVVLLNDWSARDIQALEYVPLGPFLGKSFATSISPWVVPLDALSAAWVPPPPQDPEPARYLHGRAVAGLDLAIEVRLNGTLVSRPPFRQMYWTPAQQLAHMTVNGASLRTGDLYGSGTVSGWNDGERGSLLELAWNGASPITLDDGSTRSYLQDGDTVSITATAPAPDGSRIGLGEVTGTVTPARAG